jgi:ribosome maturation factor RimP
VRTSDRQLEAVRAAVEPAIVALGLDLYDVELTGGGGARTLRITVTGPHGVDLEAITAVTRAVSPILDDAVAINGRYLLEVSSPGVERALRLPEHYDGARGEQVSVKFLTDNGPQRVRGSLVGIEGDRVIVETGADERAEIALASVTQARTVFDWGPQPRARAKGRS